MNLQTKLLIALFALGTIFWGCDSLIYEDLSECPQGVYVKFYSMTPCAVDSTFIGQVSDLHLFAFNDKDILVSATQQKNVFLDKDYEVLMPVSDGYFYFIGWAGVNENFTPGTFVEGVTTKKEVMLTLKSQNNQAVGLESHRVWQGVSPVVFLEDPAEVGTMYKHTAVNLNEVTNRVNVEVELHESIINDITPQDFEIEIVSGNGVMNIDATMPLNQQVLTYPSTITFSENSQTAKYSLMKLRTGYNNTITIRNKKKDEIVWQGDLIGSILLKNENINLDCQNDFDIKFIIKDQCVDCETYICWEIYVQDWLVHSYQMEMETP